MLAIMIEQSVQGASTTGGDVMNAVWHAHAGTSQPHRLLINDVSMVWPAL